MKEFLKSHRLGVSVVFGVITFLMVTMFSYTDTSKDMYYDETDSGTKVVSRVDKVESKSSDVMGIAQSALERKDIIYTNLNSIDKNVGLKVQRLEKIKAKEKEVVTALANRGSARGSFMNVDMRVPSELTPEQLERLVEGTGLEGLGEAFHLAEKEHSVNALMLLSLSAIESGWGRSNFAVKRNNLVGFGAYDSDPGQARYFESKEECIMVVAEHLSQHYLREDGKYFNGPNLKGMNVRYASDPKWANKIASTMELQLLKLKE